MADSTDSNLKENLREDLIRAGALRAGYAAAGKIPDNVAEGFKEWLEKGFHAGMTFL